MNHTTSKTHTKRIYKNKADNNFNNDVNKITTDKTMVLLIILILTIIPTIIIIPLPTASAVEVAVAVVTGAVVPSHISEGGRRERERCKMTPKR